VTRCTRTRCRRRRRSEGVGGTSRVVGYSAASSAAPPESGDLERQGWSCEHPRLAPPSGVLHMTERFDEWAEEKTEDLFAHVVPRMTDAAIMAELRRILDKTHSDYQDFLSKPDA
jgi:hypothetical protein